MIIYHNKSFKDITTFKIGGPIENLYYPSNTEDLKSLVKQLKEEKYYLVGAGSKILAANRSFKNVVCMKMFEKKMSFNGCFVDVGAGAYAPQVSYKCTDFGLSGLEFLVDIPATMGGAVVMNAGFMGNEMSQICESVSMVDSEGESIELDDIKWSRRWSSIQNIDGIVTNVRLKLLPSTTIEIKKRIKSYQNIRLDNQPMGFANAGGIFINHIVLRDVVKYLPYMRQGDAEIVANCPNFIINHGSAKFDEVLHLINLIEEHAKTLGISMKREIKIMGGIYED